MGKPKEVKKILISENKIKKKVKVLAGKIARDYKKNIYCVSILKGAVVFLSDLSRELSKKGISTEFNFMKVSSYSGTKTTGKVKIELDVNNAKGKNVLIVEDIVDTGITLDYVKKHLLKKGAKSVKICALMDKPSRRIKKIKIDYLGFTIPNYFIVGYGTDYNEKYRNLPFVGILKEYR